MSSEDQVAGKRGQLLDSQPERFPDDQTGQPSDGQPGQPSDGQPGEPPDVHLEEPTAQNTFSSSDVSSSGDTNITLQSLQKEIENLRADLSEERKRRTSLEAKVNGQKVAFFARVSPTIVGIQPWATIVFSNVETNIGGAFNSANGEFVAPVSGVYVFFCSILAGWGLIIETVLQVNGQSKMLIYSGGPFQACGSNMAVLQLNIGDVVKMVKHGPWGSKPFTIHHNWSTFSGYLLQTNIS